MTLISKYDIGSEVYLKTDKEQIARMVIGINFGPAGSVRYNLVVGTVDTWHFEMELQPERDLVKATTE